MAAEVSRSAPVRRSAAAIVMHVIILIGFFMAVAGVFMKWGGGHTTSHELIPGSSGSVHITHPVMTGEDAGHPGWHYGYTTLGMGIVGVVLGVIALAVRAFPRWPIITAAALGILNLTLILRSDTKVTALGSVRYAIRHGDWTLGYTVGPGTALIGFVLALIAGVVLSVLAGHRSRRLNAQ